MGPDNNMKETARMEQIAIPAKILDDEFTTQTSLTHMVWGLLLIRNIDEWKEVLEIERMVRRARFELANSYEISLQMPIDDTSSGT